MKIRSSGVHMLCHPPGHHWSSEVRSRTWNLFASRVWCFDIVNRSLIYSWGEVGTLQEDVVICQMHLNTSTVPGTVLIWSQERKSLISLSSWTASCFGDGVPYASLNKNCWKFIEKQTFPFERSQKYIHLLSSCRVYTWTSFFVIESGVEKALASLFPSTVNMMMRAANFHPSSMSTEFNR